MDDKRRHITEEQAKALVSQAVKYVKDRQCEKHKFYGEVCFMCESEERELQKEQYAIAFAEWLRNNTVSDGAPKLLYRGNDGPQRQTIPELYRNHFKPKDNG